MKPWQRFPVTFAMVIITAVGALVGLVIGTFIVLYHPKFWVGLDAWWVCTFIGAFIGLMGSGLADQLTSALSIRLEGEEQPNR